MAFQDLNLDDMHELLIAAHKALNPDIDVSEMSDAWIDLRTLAGAVTDNSAHIKATKADLMPGTATGETQVQWGEFRGVTKKGATPARKAAALRIYGTAATSVPDEIELNHVSGLTFRSVGASIVGAQGYVDVGIVAIDVGSKTRLSKGETLTFATPEANLSEEAELVLDIDEDGTDEETEEQYRARYMAKWKEPPLGGAPRDYVQWALEVTGFASAYAYDIRGGLGTVHLAALHEGSGNARIPSAPEVAALEALINPKRPSGMKKGVGFRVLQVIAQPTNVEAKILTDGTAEHEFDWDDSDGYTAHAATPWDGPNRKLKFAGGARPPSLQVGSRLTIGNGATGAERVVESFDGADMVVLEVDENGDIPLASSPIYAGGPLVEPVRAAILDHIDNLGTANPDAKRYGAWEGNLRPVAIGREATSVDGVLDVELVTPTVTVVATDPPYPDNGSINLITRGRCVVRKLIPS